MICLDKISKRYGNKLVLSDVSLQIENGECIVLMGHNGSGKSTLLRLLAELIYPTQGKITRESVQKENKSLSRKTGYAIDRLPRIHFSAEQYLLAMGSIQGLSQKTVAKQVNHWFELFGLTEDRKEPLASFSKGMKQKVNLIQSMLGDPDLLLLDEPMSGLDKETQNNLIKLLIKYKKKDTILVCATHENFIVKELADRIVELERGKIKRIVMPEEIGIVDTVVVTVANLSEASLQPYALYEGVIELVPIENSNAEVKITMYTDYSDILLSRILADGGSIQTVTRDNYRYKPSQRGH